MPFISPVITGVLAYMAFISGPLIYGGIYMGRYGGGRGRDVIYIYNNNNNIIIYNIYSILARS